MEIGVHKTGVVAGALKRALGIDMALELGPGQVRVVEVRPLEIEPRKMGLAKVESRKIDVPKLPDAGNLRGSLIPLGDPLRAGAQKGD